MLRCVEEGNHLIDAAESVAKVDALRPAWMRRAACRGHDTAMFFPSRGKSCDPAKAVCAGRPVRPDCFDHALALDATTLKGVWGGATGRERRRHRREQHRRPEAA